MRYLKFIGTESRMVDARGWEKGKQELRFNGYRIPVEADTKSAEDGWSTTI